MENYQDPDDSEEPSGNGFQKRLKRGGRRITLKFAGTCADCGAGLAVGSTARWYGRGRIYGLLCHSQDAKPEAQPQPKPQADLDSNPAESDQWQPNPEPKQYDCTIH